MATLTITLDTGAGTITRTKILSAGDLTKLQNSFTAILKDQGIGSPTQQQVVDYWINRWVADTIATVRNQQAMPPAVQDIVL